MRAAEGGFDEGLLAALVESDRCREVHVSHNSGLADEHRALPVVAPWWWGALVSACRDRPDLVVFCESKRRWDSA